MSAQAVAPKLVVSGADAALDYYTRCLDARTVSRYPIGERVVFAELEVLGCRLTIKDADDTDPAPDATHGPILDVSVDDPDAVAHRMVAEGAEVVFEIQDQPYWARGGRVRDPFGVQWLLQTPVTMSPQEWERWVREWSE